MNKNLEPQDEHQGMPILAFAIVSQEGLEDFPNDLPDRSEEQVSENESNETPEMPEDDDLGFDEQVGIGGKNAISDINKKEIDQDEINDQEIGEQEEANDEQGLPVQPPTPPSDLDETTI